jgi:diamine N-acetyltransferase
MIRGLELRDLTHMYEWMHDAEVTSNLQADFANFTIEKVEAFIKSSMEQTKESENLHFAIVDEKDNYMGTISLKNINRKDKNAEYAIVTRKCAHGKGYAASATKDILEFAFEELELEKVYLYVSVNNIGANKFYYKCGFVEEGVFRKHLRIKDELTDIRWFSSLKEEFEKGRQSE